MAIAVLFGDDVQRYILANDVWNAADLGERFGCSEEVAGAFLELYGYSQAQSGLWRLDDAEDAVLVRRYHDEITYAFDSDQRYFEKTLRERTEQVLSTGEMPGIPELGGLSMHEVDEMSDDELAAAADDWNEIEDDDLGDSDSPLPDELPLGLLTLECACGEGGCEARVKLSKTDAGSRLDFIDRQVDHFVFPSDYLATAAFQLSEADTPSDQ